MTHPDTSSVTYPSFSVSLEPYSKSTPLALRNINSSVKVESTDSPDLNLLPPAHSDHNHPRDNIFRFGSESASSNSNSFTFMSAQQWHPGNHPGSNQSYPIHHSVGVDFGIASNSNQSFSVNDDYEDRDEFDLDVGSTIGSLDKHTEKQVRRRSSKACDQCRKLKCKCERTGDGSLCRSCLTLNAKCTFLGPSRKRGPPKGYIEAIEVRLHQTEALIGILLSMAGGAEGSEDERHDARARSLIEDLSKDSLAREIINRVDNSPYGFKGRQGQDPTSSAGKLKGPPREHHGDGFGDSLFQSTHPSHEWQDRVVSKMQELADKNNISRDAATPPQNLPKTKPTLNIQVNTLDVIDNKSNDQSPRRLRRKIDSHPEAHGQPSPSCSPKLPSLPHFYHSHAGHLPALCTGSPSMVSPVHETQDDGEREEELEEAVGQLSLNEDEQVRFHGKASGLHLLGVKERIDGRNEGGIWRFPKARVWPPVEGSREFPKKEEDFAISMPDQNTQERLMDLYWTHVHPALPIVHKQSFLESFQRSRAMEDSPYSAGSQSSNSSNYCRGSSHVPTVLLLAMFSIAARYSEASAPLPPKGSMWTAGDSFLDSAKIILGTTYSTPRVGTCQALLLLGYREVGIGAMAQAWIYVGMAVRMAQDLGMHKSADKWQRVGGNMFSSSELQERRRIWFGCVVMDKYISVYIGRPIAISERDFDTELPSEDEMEETEDIRPRATLNDRAEGIPKGPNVTSRCISCFNASAQLSVILSRVIQAIYAIRPDPSRTMQLVHLDELLEKWYLDLPESLRFDPMAKAVAPPPHVLTLHMQYWCTVLLLHRPFIRHLSSAKVPCPKDMEFCAASRKSYDICVQAANKITGIVVSYLESYCIKRSSVFLCYFLFTASITHLSTLKLFPDDPQARLGLTQCMDTLKLVELTWPSAGRAWELLNGSKVNLQSSNRLPPAFYRSGGDTLKRPAEQTQSDEDTFERTGYLSAQDQVLFDHNFLQSFSNVALPSGTLQTMNIPYHPVYERWAGSTLNTSGMTTGSLSTSFLPQQYSTGFVDTRGVSAGRMRGGGAPDSSGSRYSQYWNDYSVLGQLDPTYGVPVSPELASQQHPDVFAPIHESTMYVSTSHSMFNSILPGN